MPSTVDVDVSGHIEVQEAIEDLKDDYTTSAEWLILSSADYSRYLEFGRGPVKPVDADVLKFEVDGKTVYTMRASGHEPYPFFFPAVNEYMAGPMAFVRKNMGVGLREAESAEEILMLIANSLSAQMKRNATANAANRSPGTHPDHPQVDTGNLRAGISATRIR